MTLISLPPELLTLIFSHITNLFSICALRLVSHAVKEITENHVTTIISHHHCIYLRCGSCLVDGDIPTSFTQKFPNLRTLVGPNVLPVNGVKHLTVNITRTYLDQTSTLIMALLHMGRIYPNGDFSIIVNYHNVHCFSITNGVGSGYGSFQGIQRASATYEHIFRRRLDVILAPETNIDFSIGEYNIIYISEPYRWDRTFAVDLLIGMTYNLVRLVDNDLASVCWMSITLHEMSNSEIEMFGDDPIFDFPYVPKYCERFLYLFVTDSPNCYPVVVHPN